MSSDCANCSNCYQKTGQACYLNWTQDQCANAGPDYVWCGSQPQPPQPSTYGCAQCPTCYSPSQSYCYSCYSQSQCTGAGYTWCGGQPPPATVNCCDSKGTCSISATGSCTIGLTQVSDCSKCTVQPNPPPPTTVNCCDVQGTCSISATGSCATGLTQVSDCSQCTAQPTPPPPNNSGFCCDYDTGTCYQTAQGKNCPSGQQAVQDCSLCKGPSTCCNFTTFECSTTTPGIACPAGLRSVTDCTECAKGKGGAFCCDMSKSPPFCDADAPTFPELCKYPNIAVESCTDCPASRVMGMRLSADTDTGCGANAYYAGEGTATGKGILDIFQSPNGEQLWKAIFPSIDPTSYAYSTLNCGVVSSGRGRPMWGAGCKMFGDGEQSGLASFLTAAKKFPQFANGPDPLRNIRELASFFGNVFQETGEPGVSGLVYSAEEGSSQGSLFGKGPLQLTGTINYQLATLGLQDPSQANNLVTYSGTTLTGECATNDTDPPTDPVCWGKCTGATPVQPPHGSGYNLCSKPWLASGWDDVNNKFDSEPGWTSSIWYWMNIPIQASSGQRFAGFENVSCATAHNIIQNPMYQCDVWCPVVAIAQIGCPSCCLQDLIPTDTNPHPELDKMTINRVGNFVQIADILGYFSVDTSTTKEELFCKLINRCAHGKENETAQCPDYTSYGCYLTQCHGAVKPKAPPVCGGVKWNGSASPPSCVQLPNNTQGATRADCKACEHGQPYWPCLNTDLCEWAAE